VINFSQFVPGFKPEIRSFSTDSTTPVFDEKCEKLIRLGVDPAAHPGEIDACAIALFRL
jgi:hypothetical protein